VLIFALHQLIATLGVGFLASTATFFMFNLLRPLSPQFFTEHNLYQISTRLPYFPIQILEGLWCGWALSRRLRQREMLWVWVFPALILCYATIAEPNISAGFTSAIVLAGRNKSVWSHFFGSGCRADLSDHCLDQFIFTMPFYASAAYSLGALLARKMRRNTDAEIVTNEHTIQAGESD
jgi:hypothetical protein